MPTSPSLIWPFLGFLWLIRRPGLWLRPLAGMAVLGITGLALGAGMLWWLWPDNSLPWWSWLGRAGLALGLGMATGVAAWAALAPLLMNLFLDTLAATVRREAGLAVVDPPVAASIHAAGALLLATLPERLGWTALALGAGFLGPFGIPVAAYAGARIAVGDALDTALAAEGSSLTERLAARQEHRQLLRWGGLGAGAMQLGLALLLIAWLWWLPALVCGATLHRVAKPPG